MTRRKIRDCLKKSRTILISTHVNPDLDALCCELAMAAYLRRIGKRVYIVNRDKVPLMYGFVEGVSQIRCRDGRYPAFDLAVVFDCGELKRISSVKELIGPKTTVINIDHHVTNDHFGQHNLVEPRASSTAEVLFDFFEKMKIRVDRKIAEWLYLGILTDTGSFRYRNTSAHTHEVIAKLLRYPLSVPRLYEAVYERLTVDDLKSVMKALTTVRLSMAGKIAALELPQKILERASARFDLKDNLFTLLRKVHRIRVIVIFSKAPGHLVKVNFRSTGKVDVSRIAQVFGGGGHMAASGCQVRGDLASIKTKIMNTIKKAV